MWEKKRPRYHNKDRDEHYSISSKLKSENKITDEFEIMLCTLTLEDIIALRLELAAKAVNGKLYGFKLWHSIPDVVKESLLKYAYSAARTKNEAAAFLGIGKSDFRKLLKKFEIKSFFEK
jgi:DNA-binding protein Fis|tara:strand:+ start:1643 stop:2002 length:360 start_codon:yes stop_codon:yes gene_type:complete